MQTQMYVPPLGKINKSIIVVHVVLFLLNAILQASTGISLLELLGLSSLGAQSGLIYQFVSFPWIEVGFMSVLFNSLLVWFIGSELEERWGSKFYIKFLAISTFTSGIIYFLITTFIAPQWAGVPIYGLGGITFSLLLAYGMIFSERQLSFMLIFPMKAKYFCMILVAIELYMGIFSSHGKTSWAHLSAMAVAYIYLKTKSMRARGVSFKDVMQQRQREKMKKKLHIVKDEPERHDPKDPKYWQ